MKLEIRHTTRYKYGSSVTDSVNEIRLTPRTDERQACYHHRLTIEPNVPLVSYEDFFGNRVHSFTANDPHKELVITSHSTVVTRDRDVTRAAEWGAEESWGRLRTPDFIDANAEYLLPTHYVTLQQKVKEYAAGIGGADEGVFGFIRHAAARVFGDFEYRPLSTGVHTTAEELVGIGSGVCQDFAHLLLAICRLRGVPARYVSGYHFVGDLQGRDADFEQASHAWVEAYVPGVGWQGIDPTNNNLIDWRYVKLGHGRDYMDIVPVKGIYRGTAEQKLHVTVDVQLAETG
ncbi:transglutaminase N-terminal domain-containing protein [Cohnella faecalis]|uniref:Transglutaminase family protein n=1 Tax=Cohnella faecalis TaxID=2315694 RepID=A0A398CR86_9BACL|nr:transglutaminase family protein [Cohnella faecalis]RIE01941.1 transglutaminase family protein [Cohnella faecalis]